MTRYAARALTQLAKVQPTGVATLQDVADAQGVSRKYLERIFGMLRARGVLKTARGPNGG